MPKQASASIYSKHIHQPYSSKPSKCVHQKLDQDTARSTMNSSDTDSASECDEYVVYPNLTVCCRGLIGNLPPSWDPVVELERLPLNLPENHKQVNMSGKDDVIEGNFPSGSFF